ncbi:hypothetical protein CBL_08388 [Carabus blaptoides fortunei]
MNSDGSSRDSQLQCASSSARIEERAVKRRRVADEHDGVHVLLNKAKNALEATPEDVHSTFGMMIAAELREIQDEDIVEDLKHDIFINIYNAKKKDRESRKSK